MKPPNYDDDAEFYDDLTAIIEPYRAYMDLRPVEMRPELLSAAPSSVARLCRFLPAAGNDHVVEQMKMLIHPRFQALVPPSVIVVERDADPPLE